MLFAEEAGELLVPAMLLNEPKRTIRTRLPNRSQTASPKPGCRIIQSRFGSERTLKVRSNQQCLDNMAAIAIRFEPTAGDALFQLGFLERKLQTVKRFATTMWGEARQMSAKQMLAAVCAANNELERVMGLQSKPVDFRSLSTSPGHVT